MSATLRAETSRRLPSGEKEWGLCLERRLARQALGRGTSVGALPEDVLHRLSAGTEAECNTLSVRRPGQTLETSFRRGPAERSPGEVAEHERLFLVLVDGDGREPPSVRREGHRHGSLRAGKAPVPPRPSDPPRRAFSEAAGSLRRRAFLPARRRIPRVCVKLEFVTRPSRIGTGEPEISRRFRLNGTAKSAPGRAKTRCPVGRYRARAASSRTMRCSPVRRDTTAARGGFRHSVKRTCSPSGRICGKECLSPFATSGVVTLRGSPPDAGMRQRPDVAGSARRRSFRPPPSFRRGGPERRRE